MSPRNEITIYYWSVLVVGLWPMAFAWIAFWTVRQRMWLLVAANQLAVVVVVGALLIQRSPASGAEVDLVMTWLQRLCLGLASVSALWMVTYMLRASNGNLVSVRRAFCTPWRTIVKAWRCLTHRRCGDGATAVR